MNPDDLEFEKAWLLWEKLTDTAQELWDEYEDHFVTRCQQDLESRQEPPHDHLDYDDSDIPF